MEASLKIHFASLFLANQLGLVSLQEIVSEADQRIIEADQPEPWLIKVSAESHFSDLPSFITSEDQVVATEGLRRLLRAWSAGTIGDEHFKHGCRTLLIMTGERSRWHEDLLWMDDDFCLVESGIHAWEDAAKAIKRRFETLLENDSESSP